MNENTAEKNQAIIDSFETTTETDAPASTSKPSAESSAVKFLAALPNKVTIDFASMKPFLSTVVLVIAQASDRIQAISDKTDEDLKGPLDAIKTGDSENPASDVIQIIRPSTHAVVDEYFDMTEIILDMIINTVGPKGEDGKRKFNKAIFETFIKVEK